MIDPYYCWNPDTGDQDDSKAVYAYDAELAAKRYAEWYDAKSNEYPYATHGGIVAVLVDAREIVRFNVAGEQSITYRARVER